MINLFLFVISIIFLITCYSLNQENVIFEYIIIIITISLFFTSVSFTCTWVFYNELYYFPFIKPKFYISNNKIMFEFPINKEKNFVIKWEDFKLIEIKRGGKKSFLQQYFFPNKIFSYKIIFFGPKKSMNINDGCRMFHIRKVAEIIKYLLKYAEIKNKKVEMEREVENFLAKYY